MNNLIIIGNGFDLAHGLKTSYNHFIEHLVNSHCKDRKCYNDLFRLQMHIKDYTHLKTEIYNGHLANQLDTDLAYWSQYNYYYNRHPSLNQEILTFKNQLISRLVCSSIPNNWCDIEADYFELLSQEDLKSPYFQKPKFLNRDLDLLKIYLEEYLIDQEKEAKPIESYREFFSSIDSYSTLILNFNYTHTIENLYRNEITKSKIIHIHGELQNPKNPIIFGYAANHKESRDLLDKNDKEYLRNIKKQLYKRTDNEYNLSKYLSDHKNIYLSILGHSCGLSDKLILEQILNHENIHDKDRSIRIFYYKEYESYFETQVNIDRIMNDDERFRSLIVDFESTDKTPQFNDDLYLTKFIKHLQEIKDKEPITKAALGIY